MAVTIPYEYDSSKFKLYSINILLQSINELPIADDTELADIAEAQIAANVLEEVKKEVLSEGWDINTDKDWVFSVENPDEDGYGTIPLPANILDVSDSNGRYYMRDWKLYDKKNQTFNFGNSVKCDVIWDVDFNTLSHPIRYYITIKASRIFQYRQIGDKAQYQFSQDDVLDAYNKARRSEGFTGKYSLKDGMYGFNFTRKN